LCKKQSDSTKKLSETDIINMLEFFIDNIFAMFDGRVFQQTVGIHMGTNCPPLLADLFLYSYETVSIQGFPTERYILHLQVLLECCYIKMEIHNGKIEIIYLS
jgi:hypothetical protein